MASRKNVLAERYELRKRIGTGAMAEVWSGLDRASGVEVALKVAKRWTTELPELAARFEREAKILRRVASPHVVGLYGEGVDDDGLPFLVLERLRGTTLEELITREGYLSLGDMKAIADDVLSALCVAHREGVVHRDLSPSNVFIEGGEGGLLRGRVLDFGVSKSAKDSKVQTGNRTTMGSLPFVAPEQLGDSARVGPRADLYAVGTVIYFALSGRLPFGSERGTSLVVLKREHDPPSIDDVTGEKWPVALSAFLQRCMSVQPSKRYPSADVALAAWRQVHGGAGPKLAIPEPGDATTSTLTLDPAARRKSKKP